MKRRYPVALLLALAVLGAACNNPAAPPPHKDSIGGYVCTPDEMQRVEKETLFCKKESSYFSSACYLAAIQRVCTLRTAALPPLQPAPGAGVVPALPPPVRRKHV